MAGSHQSPPGYGRGGREHGGPSNDQQRRDEEVLQTPIIGATAEAQALEAARLATLAERTRLEEMQRTLDKRTQQRQLFPPVDDNLQVYRTPIQNIEAAARITDSIQPSDSEAGRGLEQIRPLLGAARQQNTAVSQSRNRIHSRSARADIVQSAHSPGSPLRRRGRDYHNDQFRDQRRDQFAPRHHRDDHH